MLLGSLNKKGRPHPQPSSRILGILTMLATSSGIRCQRPQGADSQIHRNAIIYLACYWVGSLDFNLFWEIKVFSTKPPKS